MHQACSRSREKKNELRWDDEAEKSRAKLASIYKKFSAEFPGELEHYLTDTDIRAKDKGCRARQDKFVAALVLMLEGKYKISPALMEQIQRLTE